MCLSLYKGFSIKLMTNLQFPIMKAYGMEAGVIAFEKINLLSKFKKILSTIKTMIQPDF